MLLIFTGISVFAHSADCDILKGFPEIFTLLNYVKNELTKIPGITGLFVASIYAAVLRFV